jgi:multicomponent K+:H+ antiporter subunit G
VTEAVVEIVIAIFLLLGAAFTLIGSIGLARLDDFYMRLHGPTKATTLGVGGMLVASALHFSGQGEGVSLHELLVTIFLFMTAPVSGHLLAKTALHLRLPNVSGAPEQTTPKGVDETASRAELADAGG